MSYHWNWGIFFQPVATGEPTTYLGWIATGLEITLGVSLAGWVLALGVGTAMGIARTLPGKWLYRGGAIYVALFRNIPLIVQFFLWFWVLPGWLPAGLAHAVNRLPPAQFAALASILCLGLFTSARVCEQVRAGLQALPPGQRAAGLSLGLSLAQTYRYVLLPAAARIVAPSLTSEFLNIVKNSSVASTIGLIELSAQAQRMADYTAQPYESFLAVIGGYALVCGAIMLAMRRIEARSRAFATTRSGR